MADDPMEPTKWEKENKGRAKEPFNNEKTEPSRTSEGSDMVKQDAPRHNMNPPGPMRNGPDRATYNGRLSKEDQYKSTKAEISRNEKEKSLSLSNENNKDRDR